MKVLLFTLFILLNTGIASAQNISHHKTDYFNKPLIDLNDETHRQTLVDKEAGQYLGHVTTTLLDDDKTIYAVYPKGHGNGPIVMKRSDDGGKTWSKQGEFPDHIFKR